ncbi:hypothetical protein [Kordiimonas gwangyangensis]|uniref:hypothetical protein n=1 Tax=Kordiimonas gwangyangensis TaxID=288022 RepID=UPI00037496C6|nr:hypothetical protein [Kordiimonas gwangyangensis]
MFRFAVIIAILFTLPAVASEDGAYLHWNIDHTQRTPKPAHPLNAEEIGVLNHYKIEHDSEGRIAKVTYMQRGKPADGGEFGVAYTAFTYSPEQTVESYKNAAGEAVAVRGILRKVYHHPKGGFWTRVTFDNEAGSAASPNGYSELRVIRDTSGRVVMETRHSSDGSVVAEHNGFMSAHFVYDDNGFARYREFRNEHGELQNGTLGYARVAFKFDPHGNFLEEYAEDAAGASATMSAGFHRIEWREFNAYGMPARVYYFDAEGYVYQPYAYSAREYLPSTQRASIAFFGPRGEAVMHPQGFHRMNYIYAPDGSLQRRTRLNTEGKPVE